VLEAAVHLSQCSFGLRVNGTCRAVRSVFDAEHATASGSVQPVDDATA
jgi:hypothetical protein